MKTAIALDSWKLDIFKTVLTDAGYSFSEKPGLTQDMIILQVETDNLSRLEYYVKKCQRAAKTSKN